MRLRGGGRRWPLGTTSYVGELLQKARETPDQLSYADRCALWNVIRSEPVYSHETQLWLFTAPSDSSSAMASG